MIIRRKWYIAILAGLAVLLLIPLAACNGGEEATPTPTHAATPTVAPTVAPTATPAPTPTVAPTVAPTATAAPTQAPTATPAGPPLIPADHEGRTGCPLCHESGLGGAPQWPDDHAGRTEDMCSACHQLAS